MADERKREEGTQGDQESTIKVVDRRAFTPDGRRREEVPEADGEPSGPDQGAGPAGDAPAGGKATGAGFEHRPLQEPEGVDFTMLVSAMANQALFVLGEIPHPDTGEATVHLEQARLQIDLLDLLRVKCRGNLTPDEDRLLDKVLYQLRMLYVSKSGRSD